LSDVLVQYISAWDEKVQTSFISPAHPEGDNLRGDALKDIGNSWTDVSYWYLGYALYNEEMGLAFVEAYKEAVGQSGAPPTGAIELAVPIEVQRYHEESVERGKESIVAPRVYSAIAPFAGSYLGAPPSKGTQGTPSVESWRVPIIIERPGLLKGGAHVLWNDRTVEFIPYPGKWPMTEKFIKALESLDALKEEK